MFDVTIKHYLLLTFSIIRKRNKNDKHNTQFNLKMTSLSCDICRPTPFQETYSNMKVKSNI